MSEKIKCPSQEIDKKLSGLEYKSRPTLQEQLDTVENFREKLKTLRILLGNIKNFISTKIDYKAPRGQSTRELDILLKNFDLATEIITSLKWSKAPVLDNDIKDYKNLEKYRNVLFLYLNRV